MDVAGAGPAQLDVVAILNPRAQTMRCPAATNKCFDHVSPGRFCANFAAALAVSALLEHAAMSWPRHRERQRRDPDEGQRAAAAAPLDGACSRANCWPRGLAWITSLSLATTVELCLTYTQNTLAACASSSLAEIVVGFVTASSGAVSSIGIPNAKGIAAGVVYQDKVGGENIP